MESFKVENLSFAYPNSTKKALKNINFTVRQGEFVLVCGKSGCGKTTLLRLLKSSLSPFGDKEGSIFYGGKQLCECDAKEQTAGIGFVMQNPDNQIVTDKVWHELAFGLESLGARTPEIRAKVAEMASFFGIETWFHKKVTELSGGQKQLLNLASVMVMQPSVLILDEPTSQLDPIAAYEFLKTLERINRELGVSVIITEHRLEDVFPMADHVIVLDRGEIIADGTPNETCKILNAMQHEMCKALPTPVRVHSGVKNDLPCPMTVREGRTWLEEYAKSHDLNPQAIPKDVLLEKDNDTIIEIKDAWFRYEKRLPDVICGLNVTIRAGELFCLLGGNGTGKTTMLSLISGLNKVYHGNVFIKGQNIADIHDLYNGLLGVLPQNPQSLFVKKTVYLDLLEIISEEKLSREEKENKIQNMAELCQIEDLLNKHPYDLSGGEQQRAALAKILLKEPEILILDEPTKGMDAHFKEVFAAILADLKSKGTTILMVSHDVEFCAEFADRCALIFDGKITSIGAPRDFFKDKNFYTTSANRMARTYLADAVLANDIILACGGITKKEIAAPPKSEHGTRNDEKKQLNQAAIEEVKKTEKTQKKRQSKNMSWTSFLMLFLIPITICFGPHFFGERKYYIISLLVMLETIIPFIMRYERQKPPAREIVMVSVLCAIAVCSRGAFFMLPHFKPTAALVMIAGVCLGGQKGFLVGGVTAFVSNFFFGQGPWTPWQMFALGLIGFLAGILFEKNILPKTKLPLCIFGFLATFIIYGGIMNPASIILWQNKITWEMIATAYATGFLFDLIHAVSTVFFLWILSTPMIEKIDRVKIKYGISKN